MIALWIAYSLFVGTLCGLGAWLLETALRPRGVATRWAWMGAVVMTIGLTIAAPWRAEPVASSGPGPLLLAEQAVVEGRTAEAAAASGAASSLARLEAVLGRLGAAVDAAAGGRGGRLLGVGWALASGLMLAALAGTFWRSRRERRRWPEREVGGTAVRVAPDTGPLVAGLIRAEIVIPSWLERAPAAQRELVLVHEKEHVRARDPWLLAGGCAAVALLPWNLPMWWMVSRLRLGVELDCDARVLRRGVSPLCYGKLLLDVAGRRGAAPIGAAALLDSTRDLERRIMVMTKRMRRQPLVWTATLTALGGLALLAACETRVPTASEIDAMDVNAVESRIQSSGIPFAAHPGARYFIDGQEVDEVVARALEPGRVASIQMIRQVDGEGAVVGAAQIRILTPEGLAAAGAAEFRVVRPGGLAAAGEAAAGPGGPHAERRLAIRGAHHTALAEEAENFEGLILIDGERADGARFRALNPDEILRVRVTKGEAAVGMHPDPQARNGIIDITTRRGATAGESSEPR